MVATASRGWGWCWDQGAHTGNVVQTGKDVAAGQGSPKGGGEGGGSICWGCWPGPVYGSRILDVSGRAWEDAVGCGSRGAGPAGGGRGYEGAERTCPLHLGRRRPGCAVDRRGRCEDRVVQAWPRPQWGPAGADADPFLCGLPMCVVVCGCHVGCEWCRCSISKRAAVSMVAVGLCACGWRVQVGPMYVRDVGSRRLCGCVARGQLPGWCPARHHAVLCRRVLGLPMCVSCC